MDEQESINVKCPHCGDPNEVAVDTTVDHQEYLRDCDNCERPIAVEVNIAEQRFPHVIVRAEQSR
jgi:transcription elongation factor Elf1